MNSDTRHPDVGMLLPSGCFLHKDNIKSLNYLFNSFDKNKNQTELPPILPNTEQQSNKENDDMDVDIQKELEEKFDELFGPIE